MSGVPESVGRLALGDLDGDGNLDLFVGGRVMPGKYPEAVNSRIFRGHDGKFELDVPNSKLLERIGLVSGAIWSDLNGDGFPELILACEWGPIRIFRNDHGHLVPWNPGLTFPDAVTERRGDPEARNLERSTLNAQPSTLNAQRSTLNELTGWWNGVAV